MNSRGFTLIELMVVISIIGMLSSIILATLKTARTNALYARADAEIMTFMSSAQVAQGEKNKTLLGITGSGCSDCGCRGRDIRNIPTSDACYVQWTNVLSAIQTATNGLVVGLTNMTRDPWGSPYGLDENEREGGPTDCRNDTIRSAGPDGILGTGDDVGFLVPWSTPCP